MPTVMPTSANPDDLRRLVADTLPAELERRGISPAVAAMAANFIRRAPDLSKQFEDGEVYLVVSPNSFMPRLLDELRVRIVVAGMMEHLRLNGQDPDGVLAVNLSLILTELRRTVAALN